MNEDTIKEARAKAMDFIAAAKLVEADCNEHDYWAGTRNTGALRRASMELTRALADMRKP